MVEIFPEKEEMNAAIERSEEEAARLRRELAQAYAHRDELETRLERAMHGIADYEQEARKLLQKLHDVLIAGGKW
jgi:phage shock protein A